MTALIHTLFPPEMTTAKIKGEVRFVAAGERAQAHGSLGLLLTVCVPPPPWSAGPAAAAASKGKLREAIEAAIENALELNDAPPPGVGDLGDLDQCLSDQLYRARSVGAGGLVIYLPDLTMAGNLAGALDAEDSAVLRWWMAATAERPVMLLLDEANRRIGAYGPPTRLEHLVDPRDLTPVRTVAAARIEAVPPPARSHRPVEATRPVERAEREDAGAAHRAPHEGSSAGNGARGVHRHDGSAGEGDFRHSAACGDAQYAAPTPREDGEAVSGDGAAKAERPPAASHVELRELGEGPFERGLTSIVSVTVRAPNPSV